MKVRYTANARRHLLGISAYIARENPGAAARVAADILHAVGHLRTAPRSGRRGAVSGTREWVLTRRPYILIYRVEEDRDLLTIIAVYHAARLRP